MIHFHYTSLYVPNLCTNTYTQVEYRILVAKYIWPNS